MVNTRIIMVGSSNFLAVCNGSRRYPVGGVPGLDARLEHLVEGLEGVVTRFRDEKEGPDAANEGLEE